MKAFDLDLYNRLVAEGKTPKIVTRDGRDVRILCTDRKHEGETIIALMYTDDGNESIRTFFSSGKYLGEGEHDNDLFFADTEPTYRPYKDAEECFKDVQQHGFLIRAKRAKVYHLIVTITSCNIWLGGAREGILMDRLLDEFEYIDGQPCGVKEDCDA